MTCFINLHAFENFETLRQIIIIIIIIIIIYYYYLYCAVARRHKQFVKQGHIYNTIEEFGLAIRQSK